jgi:hypothetical protein
MRSPASGVAQLPKLQLQQVKVDRLGENLSGAQSCGAAPAIVVAVGGYHQHRQLRVATFDLAQQVQPARPGMLMSDKMAISVGSTPPASLPSASLAELAKCTGYVPCPVTPRVPPLGVASGS